MVPPESPGAMGCDADQDAVKKPFDITHFNKWSSPEVLQMKNKISSPRKLFSNGVILNL